MRRFAFAILAMICAPALIGADAPPPLQPVEGVKAFTARPKFGAAVFELPSAVRWRAKALPEGRYRIELTADVNASTVLANVPQLSARALNRDLACDHFVKVQSAGAKLTGPRTLNYDVRFRYAKRVCVGVPLEYPADVACSARIAVAALRSVITIDVRGATNPPCRIAGASPAFNDTIYALVGIDVFKRHTIDVARLLPKEFQGIPVEIRTVAIDTPPAAPVLHVAGETTMSEPQYLAFLARLNAPIPARITQFGRPFARRY